MQKNEETPVFDHDLDLFATVQFLDETPAILLLTQLCSKRGCSYEWKNGETPRLTQNWKTITCTMDNSVLLVVPGLSSSSSSSSASTPRPKDQSSDPVTTLSDKHACGKPMQTDLDKQATGKPWTSTQKYEMNKEDPTQGILVWLQPFTVNLEDLEAHVLAQSSERVISDSEGEASKVETKNGSTVFMRK